MRLPAPSLRTRVLLVVLSMAVVPLALIGLWLTRSASRSGQELLRSRLDEALERTVARVGTNWLRQRSDLLFLAEEEAVQRALRGEGDVGVDGPPAALRELFDELPASVLAAAIQDTAGRPLWTLSRGEDDTRDDDRDGLADFQPLLTVTLPIHQRFPSRELGRLEARLDPEGLLGERGVAPTLAGMVLGAFDATTGTSLLPLPFDPALLADRRFGWGGDDWLAVRHAMSDPPLTLVAAAPLSPFAGPFEDAARRGTWLLAAVALAGLLGAALITRRMTRSLERLVAAAEAVSKGDLEERIEDPGEDEVGRVARAFNTMTASLRRTLRELADRERLAAVGEFAASLAHEVRNPLTAIRIDLQRVEEALPPDSPLREPQSRALREIGRLDVTVSETLDVARTGRWRSRTVDLRSPLQAAMDAAEPAFAAREASLDREGIGGLSVEVRGDEETLEQLFLNLLLNAAGALEAGGRAWVEAERGEEEVVVLVRDTGSGIPESELERVFEPLYSTREDGTGLGLSVARRIAEGHGGRIEIESEVGRGTTVRAHLVREGGPLEAEGADSRTAGTRAAETGAAESAL